METKELNNKILAGKIFIYPTDNIYGIGVMILTKKQ